MNVYMFHYVHEKDKGYKYYQLDQFEEIIKYLSKNNTILNLKEFYNKLKNNELSSKDVLLTFDDGTRDHYENVFPVLKKYNISGTFFICNDSFNHKGLIPNKIHKLLANIDFDVLFLQFEKIYNGLINKMKKPNNKLKNSLWENNSINNMITNIDKIIKEGKV